MNESELIAEIYAAFAEAPRPTASEITSHRCGECDEVRDRLARHEARDVPVIDMQWVGDSLPLLTPRALRYFLPRYLEFSFTHRDSTACEFVLYHLAAEHPAEEYWAERYAAFSAGERRSLVAYLEQRATWPDVDLEAEWLERGIRYWSAAR
ncbi:MAG TPA: DUF6714 family protein [Polyangiaceae bacterium]|nr:DUF6714 family protein [Polyangiaceae bacterium]